MKCVIALAVLAVALPAVFCAPRPGYLAGTTLLRSADLLDGTVISAPATLALAPTSVSSHSTVIAHPSPAIAVAHAAPIAVAHSAPIAVAHSGLLGHPGLVTHSGLVSHSGLVAHSGLIPAGRTTVVAGPSGTITETQGLGAVAVPAW